MKLYALVPIFLILYAAAEARDHCILQNFGNYRTVCMCNATYCDSTPKLTVPETGSYIQYTTSKSGLRLHITHGGLTNENTSAADVNFFLNPNTTYQHIHGFGGAFTDSAGFNIKSLSEGAQENLIRSYFSEEGSNYNLGRVPVAGCDFSMRKYTYDDFPGDVHLEHFDLAYEDREYKIPLMQRALELNPELKFFAASWTAPPWMKTNDNFVGFGFLRDEYYQLYADYLLKFLDEYKKNGLEMWAISTGNEPLNVLFPIVGFNSMGWLPSTVAKWVANNFGPTLSRSQHNKTLILALDDQRFGLAWFVDGMFTNELAKNYTAGIAYHWYWDTIITDQLLDLTHRIYPDKFILMTEASQEFKSWLPQKTVQGSWERGEAYITDIFGNLRHWVTGWVDWNLALNKQGGPNWNENFVDSSILVNAERDEFYKQPLYYAIAHFSKFIPRNSVRVEMTQQGGDSVQSVAFTTPKNNTVIVLYNTLTESQHVIIHDPRGGNLDLRLEAKSLHTVVYK